MRADCGHGLEADYGGVKITAAKRFSDPVGCSLKVFLR